MGTHWQKKLIIFLAVTKKLTQECSFIYPAFKVAMISFYEQRIQTVSLFRLSSMEKLAEDINVWIESGVQSTNSQWFIYLNQLYITLGKTFFQSLPGYHAFTGWDYTASFSRRGKVKALNMLGKNVKFQQMLISVSALQLLNRWLFYLISGHVWCMGDG